MKYIIDTDKLPCNNGKNCTTCPFWSVDDTCEITEQVKKLPKYEERPRGTWIDTTGNNDFVCSVCNHKAQIGCIEYCGSCGADMRKRGDRHDFVLRYSRMQMVLNNMEKAGEANETN